MYKVDDIDERGKMIRGDTEKEGQTEKTEGIKMKEKSKIRENKFSLTSSGRRLIPSRICRDTSSFKSFASNNWAHCKKSGLSLAFLYIYD